jgi:hypothetical protein
MKRALIASILGMAASVVSSYGQAQYFFDTYQAAGATPAGSLQWTSVQAFAPAGRAGAQVLVSDGFVADLLWHDLGNGLSGDLGLAVPTTNLGGVDGYIAGPNVSFDPTWTGAALTLTINVVSTGPLAASGSLSWTELAQTAGAGYEAFQNMPQVPIIVTGVPEPTTMALLGLGAAGLLIIRKRQ